MTVKLNGKRVRAFRNQRGWSVEDACRQVQRLAEQLFERPQDRLGISPKTWERAEGGIAVSGKSARAIALAFVVLDEEPFSPQRLERGILLALNELRASSTGQPGASRGLVLPSGHLSAQTLRPTSGTHVRFIESFELPQGRQFTVMSILQRQAKEPGAVEVVARTCRGWLVGQDEESTTQLREAMVRACRAGSCIVLVVQKPTVAVPFFSGPDMERLRAHLRESVAGYLDVRTRLTNAGLPGNRVRLAFADQALVHSMTRIRESGEKHGWLLVSVRTDFKPAERSTRAAKRHGQTGLTWDPQMLFRTDMPQAAEYLNKFEMILKGCTDVSRAPAVRRPLDYEEYRDSLQDRFSAEIRRYDSRHGSRRRGDTGSMLAAQAVRHFLTTRGGLDRPPPVCVHLLVTSRCPGGCAMCKQSNRMLRQPTKPELEDLLRHISGLGALTVVLSGGDPLYQKDILPVLEFAHDAQKLPSGRALGLGMLTRGIRSENGTSRPLDVNEAQCIARTCRWIQVSMDTFQQGPHGSGASQWDLSKAVKSVQLLWDALDRNPERAEICCTITKHNISEVKRIAADAKAAGLPPEVPVRLKLAHSREPADFLCSLGDLGGLMDTLRELKDLPALEYRLVDTAGYLWHRMEEDPFMLRNVASGHPVETALNRAAELGHKCRVMDLTCTIDCDGKVYGCCYLLDDTSATTMYTHMGDLAGEQGRILPYEGHTDMFKGIWRGQPKEVLLPVNRLACARCSRHMHQNELLNNVHRLLEEGECLGLADELDQKRPTQAKDCFWL